MTRREYDWLWLCSAPGIYEKDRRKLLQAYKSPRAVREAAAKGEEGFSFLDAAKAQNLRAHRKTYCEEEAYHKLREQGIHFISCEHGDYPRQLLQICDYPSGLFYKGNLPEREETCVAVIGARMCTAQGKRQAGDLAEALAACRVSVVSGMAYGIDAKAQEACISAGGRSYAVLGCGVDICYPRENAGLYKKLQTCGGVLSEYPPGTPPFPAHFPQRNRIISGLSKLVVVVEARKKSGTLITADLALDQGRDVYAFPGRVQDALSAGCNRLIQQGAGMITDIGDFLETAGFQTKRLRQGKNSNMGLARPEILLYSCLDSESKSLQELLEETNLPIGELMSALSALQIRGFVTESAKNYYAKQR